MVIGRACGRPLLGSGSELMARRRPRAIHEARTGGVGDPLDLGRGGRGGRQRGAHQGQQAPYMVAGGQLRDHTAIGAVQIDLAEQLVGQQALSAVEDRHGAFVTGGFEGQDTHRPKIVVVFAFAPGLL